MARKLLKAAVGGLVVAASLAVVTAVGMAPAAAASPVPITDYANYPDVTPSIIPDGCTTDAAAITVGEQFTVTSPDEDPETVTNLRDLEVGLTAGTVVEMTWTGFASGCEGAGISLSAKHAESPSFDPDDLQTLISSAYAYCGPLDAEAPCQPDGGVYRLQITLPSVDPCYYQVDAVTGPPLQIVGNGSDGQGNPVGSFYSEDTRLANDRPGGFNTLISAANGGPGECTPPPPPCEWDPELPADDPGCVEPCEFDPELPADDPGCTAPPPPCEWDPELPADDPGCVEPCELDPELPADDPGCTPPPPPCEWDPELPADDPGCVEPCEFDPELPADDPGCTPPPEPCELDPSKTADDPTCGEEVGGNVILPAAPRGQLPVTGSDSSTLVDPAGLLLGLGAVLVLAAHRRKATVHR